jgi:hypothetical protein
MSAVASGPRHRAIILAVWLAAGGLILAQVLLARHLYSLNQEIPRTDFGLFTPSDRWRFLGMLGPVGLVAVASLLQCRWTAGIWRTIATLCLVCLVPISFFALLVAAMGGPGTLDSVRRSDGHRYVLALEPIPTDSVYTLYEEVDPLGLVWREVSQLDYSEDGRFIGDEHLVLSPQEDWLLIKRDGVWTDCFQLVAGEPVRRDVQPFPDWSSPDYESNMRLRSARIATLTGLRP